jgi:hypothetical protein
MPNKPADKNNLAARPACRQAGTTRFTRFWRGLHASGMRTGPEKLRIGAGPKRTMIGINEYFQNPRILRIFVEYSYRIWYKKRKRYNHLLGYIRFLNNKLEGNCKS